LSTIEPSRFWHPFADMSVVGEHELVITRGEGVHVWDADDRRYIDGSASLWYALVGHGRREIAEAAARQMAQLEAYQTFGDLANPPARELCARVAGLAGAGGMDDTRVYLASGGGDGVEAAAKLARQYWITQGMPERTHLISRTHAYHGTHGFGTSLSGMEPIRADYGPLVGAVSQVPHDDPDALEAELRRVGPERVAAFFLEPVIGAGGVRPAPPGYIEAVGDLCERHGVLLVVDAVITAFGRVGTWLGYERWPIQPDMVVLAKGITSGYLPLGALVVSDRVAAPFWEGPKAAVFRHGATYSGHPACCAAALANLDILEAEELVPRGRELEGDLWDAVSALAEHPAAGEIRGGVGLAAAVELHSELQRVPGAVSDFMLGTREAGVLTRQQAGGVAVGPPLTITREQIAEMGGALRAGLDHVLAVHGAPA
jgi:putrescine aminotransferase